MKSINGNTEKKLSEQFVEFIDLTDENLEEISAQGAGHGRRFGFSIVNVSSHAFAGGSCGFGSCESCESCGSCGFGFGSCSCGFFSCGFGFGSCGF